MFYSKVGEIQNIHEKTPDNNCLLPSLCFPDFYSQYYITSFLQPSNTFTLASFQTAC